MRAAPHPRPNALVAAAGAALSAQREIARTKEQLGLLQPTRRDPNRTGLIGPDWSEIATTMGDLQAKRTVDQSRPRRDDRPHSAVARSAARRGCRDSSFPVRSWAPIWPRSPRWRRSACGPSSSARSAPPCTAQPTRSLTWIDMEAFGPARRHLARALGRRRARRRERRRAQASTRAAATC